ncbi:hypothetical protein C8D88_12277 [Lentzea atacamensis]|uniref:PA domain-containing protein n=1 Tax=Lentzea atacamensis TaxID=531938 RepID=A0A316HHU4_9PSEU|nr:PA domain-containing protein [Lentzea atacamensis]PWK80799.1 hypothetical protein C8D88_12277 [Lentzea atacamensis]
MVRPKRRRTRCTAQATGTPQITDNTTITGPTTYVGGACAALPAGTGTALVERGTCAFQVKLDNITAAGYTAGIVFQNVRPDCLGQVSMLASGTIPDGVTSGCSA